jgi:hypothetical protein
MERVEKMRQVFWDRVCLFLPQWGCPSRVPQIARELAQGTHEKCNLHREVFQASVQTTRYGREPKRTCFMPKSGQVCGILC